MMNRRDVCLRNSSIGMLAILFVSLLGASTTRGQTPPITDITFAPDGKSLVACSQEGLRVFTWPELMSQKKVKVTFANLHCVVFSLDGTRLAVGGGNPSEEGVVEVFSWPELKSHTKLSNHNDSVVSVAWRSNTRLVSASLDRLLNLWDLGTQETVRTYRGHSRGVTSTCILKNGQVVSAGYDQSVRVWHGETGALVQSLNQHSKPVHAMSVCPTSEGHPMVATAAGDRTIRFWQPTIGRMKRYVRLDSEPLDIDWISGTRILAGCIDGQARVVDTENVKVLKTIPSIKGWAYAVAAHPNDGTFAIAGSDGQLRRYGL